MPTDTRLLLTTATIASGALMMSGCVLGPTDGQSTPSWSTNPVLPVSLHVPGEPAPGSQFGFKTYDPNSLVSVHGSSELRPLADKAPVTDTGETNDLFGMKWRSLSGQIQLNAGDGIPGASGRAAIVAPALSPFLFLYARPDVSTCSAASSSLDEYKRQCRGLPALVCSDDYRPLGSEPIPGGFKNPGPRLTGCPRTRKVSIGGGDTKVTFTPTRGPVTTTISLASWTHRSQNPLPVELASDVTSFLEIHDSDPASTRDLAIFGTHGTQGGTFRRVIEGYGAAPDRRMTESVGPEQPRLKTALANPTGISGFKYYDSGVCSVVLPWRTLLNEIARRVESAVSTSAGGPIKAYVTGWTSLTPILKTADFINKESQGAFSFAAGIVAQGEKLGFTGEFQGLLQMTAELNFFEGEPSVRLVNFDLRQTGGNVFLDLAEALGGVNVDEQLQRIRAIVEAQLPEQLLSVVRSAQGFVRRTNYRPEGIELVLADDITDPAFPLMRAAGICEPITPGEGEWGVHLDPPSPHQDTSFRDTKDPNQFLSIPSNPLNIAGCWAPDGTPLCGFLKR
jgi:hypothetical protein